MILFIGDTNRQLAKIAQTKNVNAVLITQENVNHKFSIGYSGIKEFNDKKLFLDLLLSAKEIFYHPETCEDEKFAWQNPTATNRGLTENYLLFAKQQGIKVNNLCFLGQEYISKQLDNYLTLVDTRKSLIGTQIWGAGCSFTYGVGVTVEERYINLVAKQFNMPVNCLAQPGASIAWAADQLLRSDIQKNDLVIWGLTSKNRLPIVINNKIEHVNAYSIDLVPKSYKKLLTQALTDDENLIYRQLTCIYQVINFCHKIGAKLVLLGIFTEPIDQLYLSNNPYFYQCSTDFIDLGSDNNHPGPKQHELYADIVIKQLNKNY